MRPRRDQEADGAAAGGLAQTGSRDSGGGEADPQALFTMALIIKKNLLVQFAFLLLAKYSIQKIYFTCLIKH